MLGVLRSRNSNVALHFAILSARMVCTCLCMFTRSIVVMYTIRLMVGRVIAL